MVEHLVEIDYHFPAWRNRHPDFVHSEPTWWPVVQVLEHHFPYARIVHYPWFAQYLTMDEKTGITADWTREGCRVRVSKVGTSVDDARKMPLVVNQMEDSLRDIPGFYKEDLHIPNTTDGTLRELLDQGRQFWLEDFVEKRRARDDALKRQAR